MIALYGTMPTTLPKMVLTGHNLNYATYLRIGSKAITSFLATILVGNINLYRK
jgi:hypothetical protein